MSDFFEVALAHTFGFEGGYANQKHDHGGPTNMGITLATLKRVLRADADLNHDGVVDARDVKVLTSPVATYIYRREYWDRPGFGRLNDLTLAIKVFDLGVHAGTAAAVAVLQRAVNEARPTGAAKLKIDGVLGPLTLAAAAACDRDILLAAFCSEQASLYLAIIGEDPTQEKFKRGWLKRARWPFEQLHA